MMKLKSRKNCKRKSCNIARTDMGKQNLCKTARNNGDDYTVRIRFRLPKDKIGIYSPEKVIGKTEHGADVILKSVDNKTNINEAGWLVVKAEGWQSKDEAESASNLLVDVLCKSLAANNLGADLGRRTPGGGFFRMYLNHLEQKTGKAVLNDERGPMVYETSLNPLMAMTNDISAFVTVNADRFTDYFSTALKTGEGYSAKERMAFDLFSMAHRSAQSADARFVLHFAALETLIEPIERPISSQKHVDRLIEITRDGDLQEDEKKSLEGTLKWLKSHSIRSAGRQFVQNKLGDMEINGRKSSDIFIECYNVRNRLLHGQEPLADWRAVSNLVGPLEQMLSCLLAKELREFK